MNQQPTKKQLDTLWAKVIKARAGNRCEYSGRQEYLHAHHIMGKTNHRLRWELDNGICLSGGVHKYVAHRQDRALEFAAWAILKRGTTLEKLKFLKWQGGKVDKMGVKLYLDQKLEEFTREGENGERAKVESKGTGDPKDGESEWQNIQTDSQDPQGERV